MEIRLQRGGLAESMETAKTIPASPEAIVEYARKAYDSVMALTQSELDSLLVEGEGGNPDMRIGWPETYLVTYEARDTGNRVVFGMCSAFVDFE
jgi:hypothetical protein